jgi:hypothetical protein
VIIWSGQGKTKKNVIFDESRITDRELCVYEYGLRLIARDEALATVIQPELL